MLSKVSYQNRLITDYDFIPSQRGHNLLRCKQYTYFDNGGRRYYCTNKHGRCRARLKLGVDGKIQSVSGEHCHPPPVYVKTSTGKMVKVG